MGCSFQCHYITPRLSDSGIPDTLELLADHEKDMMRHTKDILQEKLLNVLGNRVSFLGCSYARCENLYLQEALTCYAFASKVEKHVGFLNGYNDLQRAQDIAKRLLKLGKTPEPADWETRSFRELSVPLMKPKPTPVIMVEYTPGKFMEFEEWRKGREFVELSPQETQKTVAQLLGIADVQLGKEKAKKREQLMSARPVEEEKARVKPKETKKKEPVKEQVDSTPLPSRTLVKEAGPKVLEQYERLAGKIEGEKQKGEKANSNLLHNLWVKMGALLLGTDPSQKNVGCLENVIDCYCYAQQAQFKTELTSAVRDLQSKVKGLKS